jgi:hypothetical protein
LGLSGSESAVSDRTGIVTNAGPDGDMGDFADGRGLGGGFVVGEGGKGEGGSSSFDSGSLGPGPGTATGCRSGGPGREAGMSAVREWALSAGLSTSALLAALRMKVYSGCQLGLYRQKH